MTKKRIILISVIAVTLLAAVLLSVFVIAPSMKKDKSGSTAKTETQTNGGSGMDIKEVVLKTDNGVSAVPLSFSEMTVTADGQSMRGLSSDAVLTIRTDAATTAAELASVLSVTPETALSITERDATTFSVTPLSGTWRDGTLYRLSLGDAEKPLDAFAFQISHSFRVKSYFPADEATDVPTDTGIEIAFTEAVSGTALDGAFTVSPEIEVKASLYPDGKTVVLIPQEKLAENTVYTVTVSAALTAANGETLGEDGMFAFRTADGTKRELDSAWSFWLEDTDVLAFTGDTVSLHYDLDYWGGSVDALETTLRIFRFHDIADALARIEDATLYYDGNGITYDTDALEKVYDGDANRQPTDHSDTWESGAIPLPLSEAGYYLCELTVSEKKSVADIALVTDRKQYCFVQISDLRAYTESADGTMLLWLLDKNGSAVADAAVSCDLCRTAGLCATEASVDKKTITATTAADGVAVLKTGDYPRGYVTVTAGDASVLVLCSLSGETTADAYHTVLYTDRSCYFADDTVHYFGVIGRTRAEQTLPTVLYLDVGYGEPTREVTVNADGTFDGYFSYEAFTAYGMSMRFSDADGNTVLSGFISVTQEEKPVYTAVLTFDKPYYTYGEQATLTVNATFFDGTPAPELTFQVYEYQYLPDDGITLTTDENGMASYTYRLGLPADAYNTYPDTLYANAELIGYETTALSMAATAKYFHASAHLQCDRPDGETVRVTLSSFDYEKITSANAYDAFTGENAVDGTVSVRLCRDIYTTVVTGTTYDPITKVTNTDTRTVTTREEGTLVSYPVQNGELLLPACPSESTENRSVYLTYRIYWTDPVSGYTYQNTVYAEITDAVGSGNTEQSGCQLTLTEGTGAYLIGETVSAGMFDGKNAPLSGVPMLYTVYSARDGFDFYTTADAVSFSFAEKHMDGVCIYGVFYQKDGTFYAVYLSDPSVLTYDYARGSTLSVGVSTDKETYLPGEEARITVTVDGIDTGKVLLSLVDEADFALGEQNFDPLAAYFAYETRFDRYGNNTFSAVTGNTGNYGDSVEAECCDEALVMPKAAMAENSGGGSSDDTVYVRETFADNPYFAVCDLQNGTAAVALTVSDNITTWRVTAFALSATDAALSADTKMGSATSPVVCTMDYFLNVSLCELYIRNDEISLSARSAGALLPSLDDAAAIAYQAVVCDENGDTVKTVTAEGTKNETAWISFGTLPTGTYTVTVTGSVGDCRDAVRKTFTVAESALVTEVTKELSVSELSGITPLAYPVYLRFHDTTDDIYRQAMYRVLWGGSGRADQLAAQYIGALAENALYGESDSWYHYAIDTDKIRETLSDGNSLIPLYSYAAGDVELTAKILAGAADALTMQKRSYLAEQLSAYVTDAQSNGGSEEEQLCAAMMGLAALGEPILCDLDSLSAQAETFSPDSRLYLTAAYACAGDYDTARTLWNTLVTEYGQSADGMFFLGGNTTEQSIHYTALGLFTASRLDRACAEQMVSYLLTHTAAYETVCLSYASYLRFYLPTEVKTASFTYSLNGETETVTLTGGEQKCIALSKKAFETFAVTEADEAIAVTATYGGALAEALCGNDATTAVTLEKTITPYAQNEAMSVVTIDYTITTDRDSLSLDLSDCIPSGARYVSSYYDKQDGGNTWAYLYNRAGQQMQGSVYVWNPRAYDTDGMPTETDSYTVHGSVSYLIRGAVRGTFTAEPAVAVCRQNETYALSERYTVTIGDGAWTVNKAD